MEKDFEIQKSVNTAKEVVSLASRTAEEVVEKAVRTAERVRKKSEEGDDFVMRVLLEIKEDLGELKGEARKTNEHLKNLNGRVATHTEQINTVKTDITGIKTKIAVYSTLAGGVITMGWSVIKSKFM